MVTEDYYTSKLKKIVNNKRMLYHIKHRNVDKAGNYKLTLWFRNDKECGYVIGKCLKKGVKVNGPFDFIVPNDYFHKWCEVLFDEKANLWGIGHSWADTWLCKFPDGDELITDLHKTAKRLTFETMKEAGKYIVQKKFYGVTPKQIKY